MAKFKSRKIKREVNETMASLLSSLKNHCNDETKECINITLQILQETEIEKEKPQ